MKDKLKVIIEDALQTKVMTETQKIDILRYANL